MLLDYVAANTIELEEVAELVDGAAEVCRAAGVAPGAARRPSCPASTRRASSTSPARAWASSPGGIWIDGTTIVPATP
jgi:hypothetical protein